MGGAVDSLAKRLVASSMLRESVVSPLSSARTKRTAVAAISAKGWRTVVSGGEVQLDNGRSSKPTTLSWDGTRMCSIRAASNTPLLSALEEIRTPNLLIRSQML